MPQFFFKKLSNIARTWQYFYKSQVLFCTCIFKDIYLLWVYLTETFENFKVSLAVNHPRFEFFDTG